MGPLVAFMVSLGVSFIIVSCERIHRHVTGDNDLDGVQKIHIRPVPRIGGLAFASGVLVSGVFLGSVNKQIAGFILTLLACGSVAFAAGLAEDLTKNVGVWARFISTMVSASLAVIFLDGIVTRVGIPWMDGWVGVMPMGVAFTLFAVAGAANAVNIIDGLNGLASGVGLVIFLGIAYVAARVGDSLIVVSALSGAGAIAGFLVWNWPVGKLFLGDGGAYLLGFYVAELCVLLVSRHPNVSPWAALVLLGYPTIETLFSIYRRKALRKTDPSRPDDMHLHTLIYRRYKMRPYKGQPLTALVLDNSLVAPYIWCFVVLTTIVPVVVFWDSTVALAHVFGVVACGYIWIYKKIARRQFAWGRILRRTRLISWLGVSQDFFGSRGAIHGREADVQGEKKSVAGY